MSGSDIYYFLGYLKRTVPSGNTVFFAYALSNIAFWTNVEPWERVTCFESEPTGPKVGAPNSSTFGHVR